MITLCFGEVCIVDGGLVCGVVGVVRGAWLVWCECGGVVVCDAWWCDAWCVVSSYNAHCPSYSLRCARRLNFYSLV